MAISIDGVNRTFRGLAELSLTGISDVTQTPLNLPKPAGFVINNNVIQKRLPTVNASGYSSPGVPFSAGYDPIFSISYGQMQPEILQFKLGNTFSRVVGKTLTMTQALDVNSTSIAGAPSAGKIGYTVAEDVVSKASVVVGNVSTPLTQVAYATFDVGVPNTFAIGVQNAKKFSTNLLAKRISLNIPYTVDSLALSEGLVDDYKVNATLITTENEVVFITIPQVSINLEGSGFMPNSDAVELNFFITSTGCQPYQIDYTGQYIYC